MNKRLKEFFYQKYKALGNSFQTSIKLREQSKLFLNQIKLKSQVQKRIKVLLKLN